MNINELLAEIKADIEECIKTHTDTPMIDFLDPAFLNFDIHADKRDVKELKASYKRMIKQYNNLLSMLVDIYYDLRSITANLAYVNVGLSRCKTDDAKREKIQEDISYYDDLTATFTASLDALTEETDDEEEY